MRIVVIDWPEAIPPGEDPDMSLDEPDAWDVLTELAEIEFRRLWKEDPAFRRYMEQSMRQRLSA